MKYLFATLLLTAFFLSCKSKKKNAEEEKIIFSALSLIQGQVKSIDTLSSPITRIQTENGMSDTTVISKDEFRSHAEEFMNLPDISTGNKKDNYDVSKSYDTMLNNLVMVYTANDPKEEITRETILWGPDSTGNGEVKTIYVNRQLQDKASFVEKELTWHVNRGFQVITKIQVTDQPEKIKIVKIRWR